MGEIAKVEGVGVLASLSAYYGMDKNAFVQTIKATVMPSNVNVTNEQLAAFCLVAKQYSLNPFTKEIFAFPSRGGIQPVVSIDGWMKLINSHPDFDGMTFRDHLDAEGKITAITCQMHRKNHTHPVEVTEYMAECRRNTDTWKQWPSRMLRHKTAIQAARYAFSFAGIMEPDEVERMSDAEVVPAVTIVDDRKQRHDDALEQFEMSVQFIKDRIGLWDESGEEDHLYSVAEAWAEIPNAAQMDLWLAPTKGGVFTTHERDVIKTKLPKLPVE